MARTSLAALATAALLAMPIAIPADAQTAEPIRYTLRFPEPHTHYVEVEASYPTGGRAALELFMAVWTPGSYLVREFSRAVGEVRGGLRPVGLPVVPADAWAEVVPLAKLVLTRAGGHGCVREFCDAVWAAKRATAA